MGCFMSFMSIGLQNAHKQDEASLHQRVHKNFTNDLQKITTRHLASNEYNCTLANMAYKNFAKFHQKIAAEIYFQYYPWKE